MCIIKCPTTNHYAIHSFHPSPIQSAVNPTYIPTMMNSSSDHQFTHITANIAGN